MIVSVHAPVTNAGLIVYDLFVTSATSATVSNSGKIGDNVSASAIVIASDSSSVTTNFGKAALQTTTDIFTTVVALGQASVTNAAGALIGGALSVAAGDGQGPKSGEWKRVG